MQKPLISILTPFKNTDPYIYECLDSILNQTYTHWELVIVDDGSTDTSYQIVSDFAKKDERVKLFKNPGQGIIAALQFAFEKSSGSYITRMDSDDIMSPMKLEVLLNNLLHFGKGHLATGLVSYFSKEGLSDGYKQYEKWLNRLTQTGANYSEIYKECVIPSPCWMVHKDDLLACDAFYPDDYPEDYDLAFRFYQQKLKVIPCKQVLHFWRDYSTRTSRTHENYAQNYFLELKLRYFLDLNYDATQPLVIWGAGFKGKSIAKLLIERQVGFIWICNNPKKIGKHIYHQELFGFNYLEELKRYQCIVTVANKTSQQSIRDFFRRHQKVAMEDYYFFC